MREKILEMNKERDIFWMLIIAIMLSFAFYVYCVSQATLNIVKKQNIEQKISSIHFSLSTLETEYITKKNSVNLQLAYSLGFKDAGDVKFVKRSSFSQSVAFNNEI